MTDEDEGNVADLLRSRGSAMAADEFWSRLEQRLADEPAPRSERERPALNTVDVTVASGRAVDARWRKGTARRVVVAVAAAAALVVAVVLVSDDGSTRTDTADGTPTPGSDEDADPVGSTTTTTEGVEPDWSFETTFIDIEGNSAVAASDEFAWVGGDSAVSTIDLETNEVVRTVELPPANREQSSHRSSTFGFGSVWIEHGAGTVVRFDPETETVLAAIDVGGDALWMEPGEDSIWLGNGFGDQAVRIDPSTNTVAARIDIGTFAGAVMPAAGGIWARNSAGLVSRIDPATNEVVATIETPSGGTSIAASAGAVWATGGPADGTVYRIDPSTDEIVATIDLEGVVGEGVITEGLNVVGGTLWQRYRHGCNPDCTRGVARIHPETDEILGYRDLLPGWGPTGGLSVGPNTVWTSSDGVVARFDFEQE